MRNFIKRILRLKTKVKPIKRIAQIKSGKLIVFTDNEMFEFNQEQIDFIKKIS